MKFYINNKELSEKVFWRTLESLAIPINEPICIETIDMIISFIVPPSFVKKR